MAFDASVSINPCSSCDGPKACLGRQYGNADCTGCATATDLASGQHLFHGGDAVNGIYVLKSGALKAYVTSADGEEQILAFYSPGDVIGFDGVVGGRHSRTTVALTDSQVCRMPVNSLVDACGRSSSLNESVLDGMGREIQRLQGMLRLERMTAEQRVVLFLINQARRQTRNNETESRHVVLLPMSRGEIGRFLDLATETVSRCLTRLQSVGMIKINRNEIELLDVTSLQRLVRSGSADDRRADRRFAA